MKTRPNFIDLKLKLLRVYRIQTTISITKKLDIAASPDSSGILTQTMAMRTMAGGGRSNVGTPPDKPVRTPSTS